MVGVCSCGVGESDGKASSTSSSSGVSVSEWSDNTSKWLLLTACLCASSYGEIMFPFTHGPVSFVSGNMSLNVWKLLLFIALGFMQALA